MHEIFVLWHGDVEWMLNFLILSICEKFSRCFSSPQKCISTGSCWCLRLFFGAKYQLSLSLSEYITGFNWLFQEIHCEIHCYFLIFYWNSCYMFEKVLHSKSIHFLFWYCFDCFVWELRVFCLRSVIEVRA